MTWIKFAIWLFGIYTAYYTALVAWDTFNGRWAPGDQEPNELIFVDQEEPVREVPDGSTEVESVSPVVSSGGVRLKQTFNLAREEAIEYLRAVSF